MKVARLTAASAHHRLVSGRLDPAASFLADTVLADPGLADPGLADPGLADTAIVLSPI